MTPDGLSSLEVIGVRPTIYKEDRCFGRCVTLGLRRIGLPDLAGDRREMTRRWISAVPSKMS